MIRHFQNQHGAHKLILQSNGKLVEMPFDRFHWYPGLQADKNLVLSLSANGRFYLQSTTITRDTLNNPEYNGDLSRPERIICEFYC